MVDGGLQVIGLEEVGLLSLFSVDYLEIFDIIKGLVDWYEGMNVFLFLLSICVDIFNIDLVNELSCNGCCFGLIFVFEGGFE